MHVVSRVILLAAVLLSLSACANHVPRTVPEQGAPFVPARHPGVWVSNGYGWVIESVGDRTRLFHLAGATCVEDPDLADSILPLLDRVEVLQGGAALALWHSLNLYPYRFSRRDALPAACAAAPDDTPAGNLAAFDAFFARHYAFFGLYGVDWSARMAQARSRVRRDTTPLALFDILRDAVEPIADGHLEIAAQIDGAEYVHEGNPGISERRVVAAAAARGEDARQAINAFRRAYWLDGVRDQVLQGKGKLAANGRIQYGLAGDRIGYLAVASMGGYVDSEGVAPEGELAALHAALDDALQSFAAAGVDAVIVDLSLNTGGYDLLGLALAGRFAARPVVAYTKRAGDDPDARDFPVHVVPAKARRFTGPVVVLTSDQTVSAGEITTLAFRALPNVRHMGQATRGSFSDILAKYLPNGWVLSLSNEIYTDPDGERWEGRGITPQVAIAVFGEQPPQGHVDAVRRVVALLGSERPGRP